MRRLLIAALCLGLGGCSVLFSGDDLRGDGGAEDGGRLDARVPMDAGDGGPDTGPMDAGMDAGTRDAGPDGGEDGGPDAGASCADFSLASSGSFAVGGSAPITAALVPPADTRDAPQVAVALRLTTSGDFALGVAEVGASAPAFMSVLPGTVCSSMGLAPEFAALSPGSEPNSLRLVLAGSTATEGAMMQAINILVGESPGVTHSDCVLTPSWNVSVLGAAALANGVTVPAAFGNAQRSSGGGSTGCLAVGMRQCEEGTFSSGLLSYGTSLSGMLIGSSGTALHYRMAQRNGDVGPEFLANLGRPPTGRIAAAQIGTQAMVVAPATRTLLVRAFSCVEPECLTVPEGETVTATSAMDAVPTGDPLLALAGLTGGQFLLAYAGEDRDVVLRLITPEGEIGGVIRLPSLMFDAEVTDLAVLAAGDGRVVVVVMTDDETSSSPELHQFLYEPCMVE